MITTEFPGGDIGMLSICGTVNDLSVVGAEPLCVADAIVVEEMKSSGLYYKTWQTFAVLLPVKTVGVMGVQSVQPVSFEQKAGKITKRFYNITMLSFFVVIIHKNS